MRFIVFKRPLLAFLASLFGFAPSASAVPPFEPPGEYVVSPLLKREANHEVVTYFEGQLKRALRLVHEFPPPGRKSPFTPGNQPPCKSDLYITTSSDTWVVIRHVPPGDTTALLRVDDHGEGCGWMQSYLVDRIFFDAEHRVKAGAFLDLVMAAAYQNYGVIPYLSQRNVALGNPVEQVQLKEAAVSSTVSFLERLRANGSTNSLTEADRERLPVLLKQLQVELLALRCRPLFK